MLIYFILDVYLILLLMEIHVSTKYFQLNFLNSNKIFYFYCRKFKIHKNVEEIKLFMVKLLVEKTLLALYSTSF